MPFPPSRRRPPPRRGDRPGTKRPLPVFRLDGIRTIAPPEDPKKNSTGMGPSRDEDTTGANHRSNGNSSSNGSNNSNNSNSNSARADPNGIVTAAAIETVPEATRLPARISTDFENNATGSTNSTGPKSTIQQRIGTNLQVPGNTTPAAESTDPAAPQTPSHKDANERHRCNTDEAMCSSESPLQSHKEQQQQRHEPEEDGLWWIHTDPHVLEGWLLKQLDAMIGAAEREEEGYLMGVWDERILMRQLLQGIEAAETRQEDNGEDHETQQPNEHDTAEAMEVDDEEEGDERQTQSQTQSQTQLHNRQEPEPEDQEQVTADEMEYDKEEDERILMQHLLNVIRTAEDKQRRNSDNGDDDEETETAKAAGEGEVERHHKTNKTTDNSLESNTVETADDVTNRNNGKELVENGAANATESVPEEEKEKEKATAKRKTVEKGANTLSESISEGDLQKTTGKKGTGEKETSNASEFVGETGTSEKNASKSTEFVAEGGTQTTICEERSTEKETRTLSESVVETEKQRATDKTGTRPKEASNVTGTGTREKDASKPTESFAESEKQKTNGQKGTGEKETSTLSESVGEGKQLKPTGKKGTAEKETSDASESVRKEGAAKKDASKPTGSFADSEKQQMIGQKETTNKETSNMSKPITESEKAKETRKLATVEAEPSHVSESVAEDKNAKENRKKQTTEKKATDEFGSIAEHEKAKQNGKKRALEAANAIHNKNSNNGENNTSHEKAQDLALESDTESENSDALLEIVSLKKRKTVFSENTNAQILERLEEKIARSAAHHRKKLGGRLEAQNEKGDPGGTGASKTAATITTATPSASKETIAAPGEGSKKDRTNRDEEQRFKIKKIRQALPKWLPGGGNKRTLLFTREDFESSVIGSVQSQIPRAIRDNPKSLMHIKILDTHPDDEHSYLLEAHATDNHRGLDYLRITTEGYVRSKLSAANLRLLLEDGASLELDVSLSLREPIGVSFSKFSVIKASKVKTSRKTSVDQNGASRVPGIWIKSVPPDGGLAKALGGQEVFDYGSAVLAADGVPVSDPLDLQNLLIAAKQDDKRDSIVLTICLARNCRLDTVLPKETLVRKFSIRRRDGALYDPGARDDSPETRPRNEDQTLETETVAEKPSEVVEATASSGPEENASSQRKPVLSTQPAAVRGALENTSMPTPTIEAAAASLQQAAGKGALTGVGGDSDNKNNHTSKSAAMSVSQPPFASDKAKTGTSTEAVGGDEVAGQTKTSSSKQATNTMEAEKDDTKVNGHDRPKPDCSSHGNKDGTRLNDDPNKTDGENKESENEELQSETPLTNTGIGDPSIKEDNSIIPVPDGSGTKKNNRHNPIIVLDISDDDDSQVPSSKNNNVVSFPETGDNLVDTDDENQPAGKGGSKKTTKTTVKSPYYYFEQKYKDLIELDFKDTKIPEKFVCFHMWEQHQTTIGRWCDDECKCHMTLSSAFANNVIQRQIGKKLSSDSSDQKTAMEEDLKKKTRGIFLYFFPRFIGKLAKEYPNETGIDLIQRLRNMWSLHQRTRVNDGLYGIRCNEDCSCEDHWESTFTKGDSTRSETTPVTETFDRGSSSFQVTKKRTAQFASFQKDSPSTRKKMRQIEARPSFLSAIVERPFEVVFDASRPLGCYFRTESGQNGQQKCVLYSKYCNGPLFSDNRLKVGSQVMAVMVGEYRNEISNHSQLRDYYRSANRKRQNLRLIFQNNHSSKSEPASVSRTNWKKNGAWIGKERNGWGGGASYQHQQPKAYAMHTVNRENTVIGRARQPWDNDRSFLRSPENHGFPFSPSPRSEWQPRPTRPNKSLRVVSLPGQNQLVDAIRNRTCRDLVHVLENGPEFGSEFVDQVLKPQNVYLTNELKKMNPHSPVFNEMEAKKKVVKLYINSAYVIDKAISLRRWSAVSIELKHLDLDDVDRPGSGYRSDVISTAVRMKCPDSELGRLPVQKGTDRIDYPPNRFSTHNNYAAAFENRRIEIEIARGDPENDRFLPQMLGAFELTLDEMEQKGPPDGSWFEISKRSETVGTIGILVRRRSADLEYVKTKKQEIENSLKIQIETVERFNKEYSHRLHATLTSNVRGINGIPLLYAAVEVVANPSLIARILRSGADPTRQSNLFSHITPLELAQKQYERCVKKAQGAQDSGRRQALDQKCADAKGVLDMLKHASIRQHR